MKAVDCSNANTIVIYLVHWVITFLPDSPSSCSFWSLGMTTVNNCRIMLAVMYGIIPRANTENVSSAPPENKFNNP